MCLVRLLHVDELFLQTPVLRQELFQLGGVVLKVTRVGGVEVTTCAAISSGSLSPAAEEYNKELEEEKKKQKTEKEEEMKEFPLIHPLISSLPPEY